MSAPFAVIDAAIVPIRPERVPGAGTLKGLTGTVAVTAQY
jgi:hypothetical protein